MSISRRGGGIGRRAGLKIRFRKEWGFDSPPRHHRLKTPDIHLGFFCFNLFHSHNKTLKNQYFTQLSKIQLMPICFKKCLYSAK